MYIIQWIVIVFDVFYLFPSEIHTGDLEDDTQSWSLVIYCCMYFSVLSWPCSVTVKVTCPFVMSNIHAVVFFSLSVSDFYNACMVYLVLYSFYSYRPVTFLLHYRYYLIILFDFNVFHILLQLVFLWYSVQIYCENS